MFRITDQAQNDLDGIWLHIAVDNDPAIADDVIEFLVNRIGGLAASPLLGRIRTDLWPEGYCFYVGKSGWRSQYGIFYRITNDIIEIARVIEGHQDIDSSWFE